MREFKYDYTICPDNNPKEFKGVCAIIGRAISDFQKKDLLIDVDGSTIQVFEYDGLIIVVYDDYDEGAVYVKSDIDLKDILTKRALGQQPRKVAFA